MDRVDIANRASRMLSKRDLLKLLNRIKKSEVEEMGLDSSLFHPFTEKQLNFYCNPNHTTHRYRQFKIKKKSGGFRQITAPKRQTFMMMLSAVNEILRSMYTPSVFAAYSGDSRSPIPVISVHSVGDLLYRRQS